jgi:hypothetical protein
MIDSLYGNCYKFSQQCAEPQRSEALLQRCFSSLCRLPLSRNRTIGSCLLSYKSTIILIRYHAAAHKLR